MTAEDTGRVAEVSPSCSILGLLDSGPTDIVAASVSAVGFVWQTHCQTPDLYPAHASSTPEVVTTQIASRHYQLSPRVEIVNCLKASILNNSHRAKYRAVNEKDKGWRHRGLCGGKHRVRRTTAVAHQTAFPCS